MTESDQIRILSSKDPSRPWALSLVGMPRADFETKFGKITYDKLSGQPFGPELISYAGLPSAKRVYAYALEGKQPEERIFGVQFEHPKRILVGGDLPKDLKKYLGIDSAWQCYRKGEVIPGRRDPVRDDLVCMNGYYYLEVVDMTAGGVGIIILHRDRSQFVAKR